MGEMNIRIDEAVGLEASKELAEMGLTLDQGVRILLNSVIAEKRLPFAPNAETMAAIQAGERGEVACFDTFEEMIADAREED